MIEAGCKEWRRAVASNYRVYCDSPLRVTAGRGEWQRAAASDSRLLRVPARRGPIEAGTDGDGGQRQRRVNWSQRVTRAAPVTLVFL